MRLDLLLTRCYTVFETQLEIVNLCGVFNFIEELIFKTLTSEAIGWAKCKFPARSSSSRNETLSASKIWCNCRNIKFWYELKIVDGETLSYVIIDLQVKGLLLLFYTWKLLLWLL